jgi:uncharacterized membrane protein YphA (DoxX/SURF4 family)
MTETTDREGRGRRVVSLVGAVVLGAILIIATVGKMLEPIVFVEQIRGEGLDFVLSASTVALLALAIEMGLGVALLLGMRSLWVLVPSAGLVAFFILLTSRAYWQVLTGQREDTYECGCFGVFLQRTASEAFWQDLFLLGVPLLMAFASRRALREPLSGWKTLVAAVSTAGVILYTVFSVGLPSEPARELYAPIHDSGPRFRDSDEFGLTVDGVEEPGARILESEATLQFMIVSPSLGEVLLLDVRTSRIAALDRAHLVEDEGYDLAPGARPREVGSFEVGAEGIAISYQGRSLVMRPRGMGP